MRRRVAIIFDGRRWHVRRIRQIVHDVGLDEKVYWCDKPIANDLPSLAAAARALRPRGRR